MDHYIDIRLRPDPEFSSTLLMGALFGKAHRALVRAGGGKIGVSFPGHAISPRTLGDCLRLHGEKAELESLMKLQWLTGMADHVRMSEVAHIPDGTSYRVVRRIQAKTNAERLRRRYAQRHQVTEEEARHLIPSSVEQKVQLPYLSIRSQSTGQEFSLFVEHMPPKTESVAGEFNSYGMSTTATIPWF